MSHSVYTSCIYFVPARQGTTPLRTRIAAMDDCIIIGAGPAGLTAAIYLARFHLKICMFDCGSSRAAQIPRTHNHAGYPGGIKGTELLRLMREQAAEFGAVREEAEVTAIVPTGDAF